MGEKSWVTIQKFGHVLVDYAASAVSYWLLCTIKLLVEI